MVIQKKKKKKKHAPAEKDGTTTDLSLEITKIIAKFSCFGAFHVETRVQSLQFHLGVGLNHTQRRED
jgi:hypothetical protein